MSTQAEIERLEQAKTDLKQAINAKGGSVTTESLSDYAVAVQNLPSGGGGTVLPTGDEWLRKTGTTHPEWGFEYEYYVRHILTQPEIGQSSVAIGNIGLSTHIKYYFVSSKNDVGFFATNPLFLNSNFSGIDAQLSGALEISTGIVRAVVKGRYDKLDNWIDASIIFFDTTDREVSQVAQMAMLQNEINDGTQALNILGVTT